MATGAAAAIARARRDVQHQFFSQDAVRPDRAIAFEPSRLIEQRQFERMLDRGIIREAAPGRYWLDVVAYDVDLTQRHQRVKIALLAIIVILLIVLLLPLLGIGVATNGIAGH
ncbi:MAG: hypothetical protein HOP95_00780 [Sphingomonas sp.]|nr:hypothetical protein [Sphingomonas sp.]